jgi:predicted dehydrogenase
VIVEKPFVPTSKEAYELDALAKEKGKLVAVFQSMQQHCVLKHWG